MAFMGYLLGGVKRSFSSGLAQHLPKRWRWPLFLATLMLLIPSLLCILLLRRGTDLLGRHQNLGIKAIYQFGDSLSDTGNYVRSDGAHSQFSHPPYGQTFFHYPTGRCTDGLLMIDYIAESFQFPYLDPYLKKDGNFNHGVNFAVAASTALDLSTLASKRIPPPNTNNSLSVQLGWFRSYLSSICHSPSDCKDKLRNALVFMGEIGGNDMFAMSQRKNMEDLYSLVPDVNQAIVNAVKEVIDHGAVRVVVPGNLPVGCMPVYLLRFKTNDQSKYDELKCLKHLNDFAKLQNDELQKALRKLQQEHPHVAIVYGDLFNPMLEILRSARRRNADLLSREVDNISLLLSLLEEDDFYIRYYTLQVLTALLTNSTSYKSQF